MDNTIWLFILLILSQGCDGQLRNGTQTEASETCNKTLASPEELQIYKNKSPSPGSLWLSLKKSKDSRWTWLDGTNLQKNVSQHPTPNHDCGLIRTADGILDESACFSRRYGFMCTIKEGNNCPSTCHEMIGTKVFVEHTENYTWFQARDNCRKRNNDLAVFPNKDRALVISEARRLFGTGHFWIGLRKYPWRFADNSEPMFYNWEQGTTASDKKCAVIGKNGWRTASCSDTHQFVCSGDPILTQIGGTTAEISITPDQTQTTARVGDIVSTDFPSSGSSSGKSKSNKGLLIGVTVSVLLVLLLCAGVLLFLYLRHREVLEGMPCGFNKAKQTKTQKSPEQGQLLKITQNIPGGEPQCEPEESESRPVICEEKSQNEIGKDVDELCDKLQKVFKGDVRNAENTTDDEKTADKIHQRNTEKQQQRSAPVTAVGDIEDQSYRQLQQIDAGSDHDEDKEDEEDKDDTPRVVQRTIQADNNKPFQIAPARLDLNVPSPYDKKNLMK